MTVPTLAAPNRSVAGRAALAVALLLGFYVLGLLVVAALLGLTGLMLANGRVGAYMWGAVAVSFAILRGLFFVERRAAADEVVGIEVTDAQEPRLWEEVRRVAGDLGTDPPAHLYLVPDVNAFVYQRSRLLGAIPGERVMGVGIPLLEILSVDELKGVLAHEYGHYTGGDTRLGPLVYRGRAAISRTIGHLGADSMLTPVFRAYGKLYLRVSQAVSRRQELAADANAARLVGAPAIASGLKKVHVAAPVFDTYVERYVGPLWENGRRPKRMYDGFRRFHDHPDHADDLAEGVAEIAKEEGSAYDSHPPLGVRLAALGDTTPALEPAEERAAVLLADPEITDDRMSALISRVAAKNGSLVPVEWDEAAEPICAPTAKAYSDRLRDGVAKVLGREARVADALTLVEEGRVDELAHAMEPELATVPDEEERARIARHIVGAGIAGVVAWALTTQNGWRWSLQWSGPPSLVPPKGRPWDYRGAVRAAVEDPAKVTALRRKLRTTGIPA